MDMSKAFYQTMKRFDLRSVDIAAKSGIAESDVSRFVNGKVNIGYQKLEKMLESLSPAAKDYFWLLFKTPENDASHLRVSEKKTIYKTSARN